MYYEPALGLTLSGQLFCAYEIARTLGKDPSTISREVRKHMSEMATGRPGY
ncbi:MAG: helix-turn-helix domain-containing protein, partial [Butyrivibrio sp.]|nr:helix-turn-helix domain-containing protein [Butyrivibrio sp.]